MSICQRAQFRARSVKSVLLQKCNVAYSQKLEDAYQRTKTEIKHAKIVIVQAWRRFPLTEERRRTRYDIYADIIETIARKGLCSLTRISYGANMPVDRAKRTLNFLVSHGFVREVPLGERRKYRATKWGLEYLETFRRMRKFFAALEE